LGIDQIRSDLINAQFPILNSHPNGMTFSILGCDTWLDESPAEMAAPSRACAVSARRCRSYRPSERRRSCRRTEDSFLDTLE